MRDVVVPVVHYNQETDRFHVHLPGKTDMVYGSENIEAICALIVQMGYRSFNTDDASQLAVMVADTLHRIETVPNPQPEP